VETVAKSGAGAVSGAGDADAGGGCGAGVGAGIATAAGVACALSLSAVRGPWPHEEAAAAVSKTTPTAIAFRTDGTVSCLNYADIVSPLASMRHFAAAIRHAGSAQ
jgi:hypothetical protein